eukprot:COSAG06_NODE_11102_length_1566_cov_6.520120_1_plen_32_part_10
MSTIMDMCERFATTDDVECRFGSRFERSWWSP